METLEEQPAAAASRRIEAPTDDPADPAHYWSTEGFDVVAEPALRRMVDYWQSLRVDGGLPSRRDIDPLDIAWALDRVYLIDRETAPILWRYRLAGARIEEAFHLVTLRGATLDEMFPPDRAAMIRQRWEPLTDGRRAAYMHGMIYRSTDRLSFGGRLLLPLGEEGRVTGLLGITDGVWRNHGGARPSSDLDVYYIAF